MMSIRKRICNLLAIASVLFVYSPILHAQESVTHVVELFTSQGCYSCPPAEKLLGEITRKNKDIIALEFHVDYWDSLVYGSAGKWQDPFSDAAYSKRQRDYNRLRLDGRVGVYTPQMIVDGQYAFVGSKSSVARSQLRGDSNLELDLTAEITEDGTVTIDVNGEYDSSADIWLVTYDKVNVTRVISGENKGKELTNYNVVRDMRSVGKWQGEPVVIRSTGEPLGKNQNCAVIVQKFNANQRKIAGPILGAASCKSV